MKTIEEKAVAFAGKAMIECRQSDVPFDLTQSAALGMHVRDAYLAGAAEALAGQWRSVEDELPDGTPFCVTMADKESRPCLCHFDGDVFIEDYSGLVCAVKCWMPIPFLPPKDESE